MLTSVLNWGVTGAGKTAFGVSSFWDWQEEKPVPGTWGRWIQIGTEANNALGVPDEMVKHFPFDNDDVEGEKMKLTKYLQAVAAEAKRREEKCYILFDGWTELSLNIVQQRRANERDPRRAYMGWKEDYLDLSQYLNPKAINCTVFATARASEPREEVSEGSKVIQRGDPDWVTQYKVFPAIEGREVRTSIFGYQYQFVVYHDTQSSKAGGAPRFMSYWLPHTDFKAKNVYGHKWERAGLKSPMVNATWPEIEAALEKLGGKNG